MAKNSIRNEAEFQALMEVNDAQTLRKAGSRTDAYAVFARMLGHGNPPDSWDTLLSAARSVHAAQPS